MSITLTQIIDQYIRACGPVSFAAIMREVKTQHGDAPEHEVAAALTGLLHAGHAVLYDDGTSFNVGPAAGAGAPVVVTVEGGVVQGVTGVPPGIIVAVHDYDIDGDDTDLATDADGNRYRLGTYGGDDAQADPARAAQPGLLAAARGVIANWEHGDLAAAVRELAAAVSTADDPAQAAHLLHRGGQCPACGSGDICGDSFEYNGDEHWQEVNCWTCGASWTDVFRLAAFTDLKPAEPEDFRCPDCGATAAQAGIVCNVCHRGMTERIG